MLGNLLGDPRHEVTLGAAVEAVFEPHDDAARRYTLVDATRAEAISARAVEIGALNYQSSCPVLFICPFRIICMSSIPARVAAADQKDLNPNIGRT
jgi:hypothetical protein